MNRNPTKRAFMGQWNWTVFIRHCLPEAQRGVALLAIMSFVVTIIYEMKMTTEFLNLKKRLCRAGIL